jgi:sulfotransferase family protein
VSAAAGPIFVVGAPRSGKTSLARSLARHSELWSSGFESFFLFELFGGRRVELAHERLFERPSPTWLRVQRVRREELLESLGRGVDSLFAARSGGRRWIDHTTDNVFMLPTLFEMFPNAIAVHVIRDGRLAVQSMLEVGSTEARNEVEMRSGSFRPSWTSDFEAACKTWAASVEAGTAMRVAEPDRVHAVLLDDLCADPHAEFTRLFTRLGVRYEERPVDFWRRRIAWRWRDGDGSSAEKKRRLWEQWSGAQRDIFVAVAAPVMARCGLASSDEASPAAGTAERAR